MRLLASHLVNTEHAPHQPGILEVRLDREFLHGGDHGPSPPRGKGRKRGASNAPWAKIKYDRQIVAIAEVAGATTIYSDDSDIHAITAEAKIAVKGLADLPLPPQSAQAELNLPTPRGRLLDFNEPPTETEKG